MVSCPQKNWKQISANAAKQHMFAFRKQKLSSGCCSYHFYPSVAKEIKWHRATKSANRRGQGGWIYQQNKKMFVSWFLSPWPQLFSSHSPGQFGQLAGDMCDSVLHILHKHILYLLVHQLPRDKYPHPKCYFCLVASSDQEKSKHRVMCVSLNIFSCSTLNLWNFRILARISKVLWFWMSLSLILHGNNKQFALACPSYFHRLVFASGLSFFYYICLSRSYSAVCSTD